jgi:hypothetical protein
VAFGRFISGAASGVIAQTVPGVRQQRNLLSNLSTSVSRSQLISQLRGCDRLSAASAVRIKFPRPAPSAETSAMPQRLVLLPIYQRRETAEVHHLQFPDIIQRVVFAIARRDHRDVTRRNEISTDRFRSCKITR